MLKLSLDDESVTSNWHRPLRKTPESAGLGRWMALRCKPPPPPRRPLRHSGPATTRELPLGVVGTKSCALGGCTRERTASLRPCCLIPCSRDLGLHPRALPPLRGRAERVPFEALRNVCSCTCRARRGMSVATQSASVQSAIAC